MPQMSPLLWSNLFILFSLMLLFSMIKIYYSTNKSLNLEKNSTFKTEKTYISWTW